MLGEVFYWLLSMSIIAAVTGLFILLLRRINGIPRRIITVLWVIPFIRMTVPVGVGGRFGLMELISNYTTRTVTVTETPFADFTAMNSIMAAESYFPIIYKTNLLENVFRICSAVWVTVAAALLIAFAIIYTTTVRELRDAVPLTDEVWVSDKITSPALYGIFRQRIIIPESYRDRDLQFVLLHERVHRSRGDNVCRVITFAVCAIHWFNPLVWVFLRCYLADMELACDECVLSKCGEDRRKDYARELVSLAEHKSFFASAFGGAKIRVRVEGILSYKSMTAMSATAFAALVAVCAYVLLTNAK